MSEIFNITLCNLKTSVGICAKNEKQAKRKFEENLDVYAPIIIKELNLFIGYEKDSWKR